tara:strand:+ start:598 stop:963 length:366 start_codon:yes stop_codon:yes gene_type:complete
MGKNAWMDHVKSIRQTPQAKGLSLKDVLILAKSSYKKIENNIGDKVVKPMTGKNIVTSVSNIENKIINKVIKPISVKKVKNSYKKVNKRFSKKFIKPLKSRNKKKKRNKTNKQSKRRRRRN